MAMNVRDLIQQARELATLAEQFPSDFIVTGGSEPWLSIRKYCNAAPAIARLLREMADALESKTTQENRP